MEEATPEALSVSLLLLVMASQFCVAPEAKASFDQAGSVKAG